MFVASGILAAMLLVFIVGAPFVSHLAHSNALGLLPADVQADALKQSSAFREILNIAAGQPGGATASDAIRNAAEAYRQTLVKGHWALLAGGLAAGLIMAAL